MPQKMSVLDKKKTMDKSNTKKIIKEKAAKFNINRMTVYRWLKEGEVSKRYKALLSIKENYSSDKKVYTSSILRIDTADFLQGLEDLKEYFHSWEALAEKMGIDRKTFFRWKKTRKISPWYKIYLYYFFMKYINYKIFKNFKEL